ncbi:SCAN domain-containing protein 3-like [Belonocnema kinseyi]|uniref:SCAN domain-containing protein 3-like n=1 Tax=Belonocnema kinseyi TaxID=2817044 RepID=UPI00143E059D|nr:SCAN domain-containing protein 3-like [Belonocnema kinseyi]
MPIMIDAVREIFGEDAAVKTSKMPHLNNIVHPRIEETSIDVKKQLKLSVGKSPFFYVQFDESVDVSGAAQLLCYIKYEGEEEIEERMLFFLALPGRTTGECLFLAMIDKVHFFEFEWNKCVAICTDGAAAMTGKHVGFVKRILELAPNAKWIHSMNHRYALAVKPLPGDLMSVMEVCVSIVNYIKTSSLKTRIFKELCSEL